MDHDTQPRPRLKLTAKSDELPNLLKAARSLSVMSKLPLVIEPYHAVADANHVIAALRFKVKRTDPPRAHFEELVAANALIVYAPTSLAQSVPAKLAEIAAKQRLPLDRLLWHWEQMMPSIHFVAPSPARDPRWEKLRGRDPEDVAYCQLCEDVGADFLLSGDNDFQDAPVTVVTPLIARFALAALKSYVRARARELQSKGATHGIALLGMHGAVGLGKALMRAPEWVQLGAMAVGLLLLLDKALRKKSGEVLAAVAGGVGSMFRDLFAEGLIAETEAGDHLDLAVKNLPRRRPSLLQAATRHMAINGDGCTLSALETELRAAGHATEAVGKTKWILRKALASSPMFEQDTDRRWWFSTRTPASPETAAGA